MNASGAVTKHNEYGANMHPDEYPEAFKVQVKKNGRCIKCFGYRHRPNQTEACRQFTPLSYEEAKAFLANEANVASVANVANEARENAIEKD